MPEHVNFIERLRSDDNEVLREAAYEAGEAVSVEAVPHLSRLLQSRNLGVQEAADGALRKIGGPATVRVVIPLLRFDDAPVRNLSMDILREVGKQDLDALFELMHDEDPDIRIFVADILGSASNVLAVAPLCSALLRDPEVNVRYQAAVSLGELAMIEAAECLNQAIQDEEWVQYAVIEALTKIGHSSSVGALVKALDRSSDLVRSMIIDALAEMGNVKAVPLLLRRMEEAPTALRNKIVKAVIFILGGKALTLLSEKEVERLREYMLVAVGDEDVEVQDAAIKGLGYIGGEDASAAVLALAGCVDPEKDYDRLDRMVGSLGRMGITTSLRAGVHSDDKAVVSVAVKALAAAGGPDAAQALIDVFWDEDQVLQREIVSLLVDVCDESHSAFFLDVLLRHEDGKVLKSALQFLGGKHRVAAAGETMFALLQHQYDDVKEAALEACIALSDQTMTARFVELADSAEPLDRLMAIYALGRIGADEHMDLFRAALEDEVPDIRKVALEGVASVCMEDDTEWLNLIVSRLTDENRDVRLTVIQLMGDCYRDAVVPYLVQTLDDPDDWVRIRAMDALGVHHVRQAIPQLVMQLGNPNRMVAIKAVEALGAIGGTTAFQALLGISDGDDPELIEAAEAAIAHIQESQEEEG